MSPNIQPAQPTHKGDLLELAADLHGAKWKFAQDDEHPLSKKEMHSLLNVAFNTLHKIGDKAKKMADAAHLAPAPTAPLLITEFMGKPLDYWQKLQAVMDNYMIETPGELEQRLITRRIIDAQSPSMPTSEPKTRYDMAMKNIQSIFHGGNENLPTPQAAPTAEAHPHSIIESYPKLSAHIERMSHMGTGSTLDFSAFVSELADILRALEASAHLAAGPGVAELRNVDGQVMVAARDLDGHQKENPEWLWYSNHKPSGGRPTFGRWQGDSNQAPYIRADLALTAPAQPDTLIREEWQPVEEAHKEADLLMLAWPNQNGGYVRAMGYYVKKNTWEDTGDADLGQELDVDEHGTAYFPEGWYSFYNFQEEVLLSCKPTLCAAIPPLPADAPGKREGGQ